jgi:hypothetical protein
LLPGASLPMLTRYLKDHGNSKNAPRLRSRHPELLLKGEEYESLIRGTEKNCRISRSKALVSLAWSIPLTIVIGVVLFFVALAAEAYAELVVRMPLCFIVVCGQRLITDGAWVWYANGALTGLGLPVMGWFTFWHWRNAEDL